MYWFDLRKIFFIVISNNETAPVGNWKSIIHEQIYDIANFLWEYMYIDMIHALLCLRHNTFTLDSTGHLKLSDLSETFDVFLCNSQSLCLYELLEEVHYIGIRI